MITDKEVDEKAQQLVRNDVIMCATWFMDALVEYSANHPDDAIIDLDDYYNGAKERCPACDSLNIEDTDIYREEQPDFDPEEKINDYYVCKDCKETFNDPRWPEIFEYWFVDDWFADKLREKGECVIKTSWASIWGRRTTGQAIYIDGVIQEIARDILEEFDDLTNSRK